MNKIDVKYHDDLRAWPFVEAFKIDEKCSIDLYCLII